MNNEASTGWYSWAKEILSKTYIKNSGCQSTKVNYATAKNDFAMEIIEYAYVVHEEFFTDAVRQRSTLKAGKTDFVSSEKH